MITQDQLLDALAHFDNILPSKDLNSLTKFVEFQNPQPGLFLEKIADSYGLYIVITGKVRLVNRDKDLIATLNPRQIFCESTLFPEASFLDYTVRVSGKTQLGYIPGEALQSLISKNPQFREHLYNLAKAKDFEQKNKFEPTQQTLTEPLTQQLEVPEVNPVEEQLEPGKYHQKVNKAYFPSPSQRVGHLWQRITRRYPFFAQQSGSDCGAACLVMVARYWGKNFSVNRLRDIANVDRNGASLRGLSAAAESSGFSTRPVKASLDRLSKQKLPAIAHWEGKHYVVVYEVTPKQVIIADPAIGQRHLTHSEFKADWTGYTLLLQPTALIKQLKDKTTPFWQFFDLVSPHGQVLLEVFITSLLIQIFGLVTPLFTQLLLDRVVVQGSTLTLTAVGLGLIIFGLFRVAMTGLRQYLLDHTANKVHLAMIVGFIRHTFRLPMNFFESRYVGDIIARVQENRKIERFLTGEALSILLDLLTVFIYVGLMFWYSWKMALLALVIVPPFLLLALIATPFLQKISREIFAAVAEESSYLIQSLTGISTVKSLAVEQTVRWRWEEFLNKSIRKNFSGQIISNRLQIFSLTIESLVTTGLLWFGAWLVIQGELTIGQLVAFNMLIRHLQEWLRHSWSRFEMSPMRSPTAAW